MAVLDLGNPTHRHIMVEQMFHDDFILDKLGSVSRIDYNLPREDRDDALIRAGGMGSSGQNRLLEPDDFDTVLPLLVYPEQNSERGEISRRRIASKLTTDHRDQLIHALLDAYEASPPSTRVEFSTALDAGVSKFELPPEKFTGYLLNASHPEGGGKAKALIGSLGIEPSDWQFL